MPQTTVSIMPPLNGPGVLASNNRTIAAIPPKRTGFRAGPKGVPVGVFVWSDPTGLVNANATGRLVGFTRRSETGTMSAKTPTGNPGNGQAVNAFLPGSSVGVFVGGDFGAELASTATAVQPGDRVYADPATGAVVDKTFAKAVPTNFIFERAAKPGERTIITGYYTPDSAGVASSTSSTSGGTSDSGNTSGSGTSGNSTQSAASTDKTDKKG